MSFDFNSIIDQFVDTYGFPRKRVIIEIERTFSSMLSRWYGMNVIVLYSKDGLKAFGYQESYDGYIQREFDLQKAKPKGWETVRRIIEQNMIRAACLENCYLFKGARVLAWGTITNIIPGSRLIVQLELEKGYEIFAECPLVKIGAHERQTSAFAIGERRAFWGSAVHPVIMNGTPRISMILNRTSKYLPAMLIKEQQKEKPVAVKCYRRFPGHKSFIKTNRFIPKNTILAVEDELHEYVQVNYDRSWKPQCRF